MTNLFALLLNITAGGALIICGTLLLSRTLETLAEGRMAAAMRAAGKRPMYAFAVSAAVTAVVQSSSAITTLSVSLAECGFLTLPAAMAVVYGANIGTTVTAQIMSLDVSGMWLYILLTGAALKGISIVAGRRLRASDILLSLGLIFLGLRTLSLSAGLIKQSAFIMNFITLYGSNELYGVFFGFIITSLAHSSSATVGLTIALFSGGVIDFRQAVSITLGDNIGTCMTAQFAGIASGVRGRRVAWGHTLYNIISAVIVMAFMDGFLAVVRFVTKLAGQPDTFLVANAHTLLNIFGALVFMPLNNRFCRFLESFVREGQT